VNDTVAAWKSPQQVPVSLTVTSPTGADDILYVATTQLLYGGSASMKMWSTGPGKATYTIYADPSTTFQYHYIRNGTRSDGIELLGTGADSNAFRTIPMGASGAYQQ